MAKDQDKHLETYLAGKSGLSSLYMQKQGEEPSVEVDQTILQAARAAISKKTAATGPFSGSWQVPAALAAVLVLVVGITLTLERQVDLKSDRMEHYAPTSEPPAAANISDQKPATGKTRLQTEDKTRRNQSLSTGNTVPAMPGAVSSPAPPAKPQPAREGAEKATTLQTEPATETDSTLQDQSVIRQEQELKPLEAEPLQTEDRWIQSIRQLVKQGKVDEAEKQLADFRRVYPGYPIPEDLKRLN